MSARMALGAWFSVVCVGALLHCSASDQGAPSSDSQGDAATEVSTDAAHDSGPRPDGGTCLPTTCAAQGAHCGSVSDGCGATLSCGTCPSPDTCSSAHACTCAPATCASLAANCGTLPDGCGGSLSCGTCTGSQTCGGGGANVCGSGTCTATTCAKAGDDCGAISDGCGHTLDCGTCATPQVCGGSGTANVCGCTPTSCAGQGATCGSIPDGCGNQLPCGSCTAPQTCGGGGVSNTCGQPASDSGAPTGCQASCTGKTCGPDGCNGTCGSCPPSQMCSATFACETPTVTGIVVDATSQRTVISPAIYGVALDSDESMQIAALNRWGGDSSGTYNWKNDVFNTGDDWNCANYGGGLFTSPSPSPTLTNSADQFVHYNQSKTADTLMTIPITGWLGNVVTPNNSPSSCAGSTQNTAACCSSIGTSESILVDKGSASLDTSYMSSWVAHLVSTFGTAASGGVRYYQLDNEPDNWQYLRADIYSALYPPGTNCESFYTTIPQVGTSITQDFINRTMAYAAAVKSADPTTNVLFMSMESPVDLIALSDLECGAPGSYTVASSLTAQILALGAQHEASTKQRILDCVDMHYPVNDGLAATQALWNTSVSVAGQPTVFPHIQGWINASYPGTGICVSEYNWSNDTTDTATAVEEADLLGMFGRYGVRLAAYWTSLVNNGTPKPAYNGMAMYRNYDGHGGRFGSVSVGAASSNTGVNVYAATDSATSPTTLWVMLVNVSGSAQNNLSITLQNFTPGTSAQVFRTTGGAAPAAGTSATVSGDTISGFSLPSGSVALLVIPK